VNGSCSLGFHDAALLMSMSSAPTAANFGYQSRRSADLTHRRGSRAIPGPLPQHDPGSATPRTYEDDMSKVGERCARTAPSPDEAPVTNTFIGLPKTVFAMTACFQLKFTGSKAVCSYICAAGRSWSGVDRSAATRPAMQTPERPTRQVIGLCAWIGSEAPAWLLHRLHG